VVNVFLTALLLATTQAPAPDTTESRWVLSIEESEARYRVREQLAGFDLPNDAVGATKELSGLLTLSPEGLVRSEESEFRIQLGSLTTDSERRDGYVQRRTLEVEDHPEALLVPRELVGLPNPLPEEGEVTFQLVGDLSLHGETQPTTWQVTAEFTANSITGLATTSFTFDTFGIAVPQVARVLSVDDNIRLELDFRMVREG
jgi:polyisoprenoid-binding protein YceI